MWENTTNAQEIESETKREMTQTELRTSIQNKGKHRRSESIRSGENDLHWKSKTCDLVFIIFSDWPSFGAADWIRMQRNIEGIGLSPFKGKGISSIPTIQSFVTSTRYSYLKFYLF